MKRFTILSIGLTLTLTMAACGNKTEENFADEPTDVVSSEEYSDIQNEDADVEEQQGSEESSSNEEIAEDEELQTCTVNNITFSVNAAWKAPSGYEGTFFTPDDKYVYQLQGISPLGSYTPQEFYDDLISYYEENFEIISRDEALMEYTSTDDVDCYLGNVKMLMENAFYDIDVLIAPQKNTVVTFAASCMKDNQDGTDIRSITDTATFQIGDMDYVTGNTFLASDGSELCLSWDGSFAYYRYADEHENEYITGTYEVYYGQPAMDQVASMEEYGLTSEELERVLLAAQDGYTLNGNRLTSMLLEDASAADYYHVCLDTFYAIILHNEQYIESPGETSEVGTSTLYIGYYLPDLEMADLTNANTANYAQWIYQGSTE